MADLAGSAKSRCPGVPLTQEHPVNLDVGPLPAASRGGGLESELEVPGPPPSPHFSAGTVTPWPHTELWPRLYPRREVERRKRRVRTGSGSARAGTRPTQGPRRGTGGSTRSGVLSAPRSTPQHGAGPRRGSRSPRRLRICVFKL